MSDLNVQAEQALRLERIQRRCVDVLVHEPSDKFTFLLKQFAQEIRDVCENGVPEEAAVHSDGARKDG